MWRTFRRWLKAQGARAALVMAPRLSPHLLATLERTAAHAGPRCPVIRRIVADNMRAAGVYTASAHRHYFAEVGRHLALTCQVLGQAAPADLPALAAREVQFDASFARLRDALATGRGALLTAPHMCGYMMHMVRLGHEFPLAIYLRRPKSRWEHDAKQRWCDTARMSWVGGPEDGPRTRGRLERIAAAVRAGRVLYIPPDLPRQRDEGTAVTLLGRTVDLPAGPGVLALRTGAPLFMLLARPRGAGHELHLRGPCSVEAGGTSSDSRAAVQRCLQWFADGLAEFLATQTPLWYFWGDKRWTRVWRGDPRYVTPRAARTAPPARLDDESPGVS